MEKHDIMDKFAEMTKKLIQQVMNEPDLRKVNPDLIREIRENVRTSSVSRKEKTFVGECQGAVLEGDGTGLVMCRPNDL
nr:MAG TPA: hypothetical protein [Caudoviricetes sp.]